MSKTAHQYQFAIFEDIDDAEPIKGTTHNDPKYPDIQEMIEKLDLLKAAGYDRARIKHRRVNITYGEWSS